MQPRMLRSWMQAIFVAKAGKSAVQNALQVALCHLPNTVDQSLLRTMVLEVLAHRSIHVRGHKCVTRELTCPDKFRSREHVR